MKLAKVFFIAAIAATLSLAPFTLSIAQTEKQKPQPKAGKPAEEEGKQEEQVIKLGTQLDHLILLLAFFLGGLTGFGLRFLLFGLSDAQGQRSQR